MFRDPLNPSRDEIKHWAYDAETPPAKDPDFDLSVADLAHADLLVRLAADPECPKRQYFLGCLYLLVGERVRPDAVAKRPLHRCFRDEIALLKGMASEFPGNPDMELFRKRVDSLLANPASMNYDDWCDFGFVKV